MGPDIDMFPKHLWRLYEQKFSTFPVLESSVATLTEWPSNIADIRRITIHWGVLVSDTIDGIA